MSTHSGSRIVRKRSVKQILSEWQKKGGVKYLIAHIRNRGGMVTIQYGDDCIEIKVTPRWPKNG